MGVLESKILVRKSAGTDSQFGISPSERKIEELMNYGIVNIDKPKGPTSHQVSAYVQKILGIKKSGHSGTLDPGVTGVLPVAFGRATRIVQSLLLAGKEYVGIIHIHKDVDDSKIKETMKSFVGKIQQLPPIKSSVKRQLRTRNIYYIQIIEIDGRDILLRVGCQAGTYIRKLAHDFGEKLGAGAHLAELRRTKAGPFDESTLCTLQDLSDAYYFWKKEGSEKFLRKIIQPVENAVLHLPKIWVFDSTISSLCHGADLKVPGISKLNEGIEKDRLIAVMSLKNELIALGTSCMDSNEMLGDSGLAVRTHKVFMLPETYGTDKK